MNEHTSNQTDFVCHPELGPAMPKLGWIPAPRYLLRRSRIKEYIKKLQPSTMLDIGCGPGALLFECLESNINAMGLENSSTALALSRQLFPKTSFPIRDEPEENWSNSFDLVMACEVIEHIEDDERALREWRDWVSENGYLLISVPAHPKKFNAADEWAGHFRRYEKKGLSEVIEKAGFTIKQIECYGYPLANVMEVFRALVYGWELKKKKKSEEISERTSDSGSSRKFESKFWPILSSKPIVCVMKLFCMLQKPFLKTNFGNGYIVIAQKTIVENEHLN